MKLLRAVLCAMLCVQFAMAQTQPASQNPSEKQPASPAQPAAETSPAPAAAPALNGFGLEDGTPVKLRLTRNLSSATDKKMIRLILK
jgi:uncharacterized protein YdeI (BOF family)